MPPTAGQTHDLVIAGDGYMLAAGAKNKVNYKKALPDGRAAVGLTPGSASGFEELQGSLEAPLQGFRRAIWSKWTGLGQGMVAGADGWEQAQTKGKVNDLVALRPVQDGGALALVPQSVGAIVDAAASTIQAFHTANLGGNQIVSIGPKIFVSANPGTNNSGFVLKATAGADILGMCVHGTTVYVSVGSVINTFNITTGALAAFAPALTSNLLYAYQGILCAVAGATIYFLVAGAWVAGPTLDVTIIALEELEGSLYLGTYTSLYRLDGQLKAKSPSTAPTVLDWFDFRINVVHKVNHYSGYFQYWTEFNFVKMLAWRGALWFFAGGRLYKGLPQATGKTLQVIAQPIYGAGLTLANCGGLLVVATINDTSALQTIWANDGSFDTDQGLGWWKLAKGSFRYVFGNSGYSQGLINSIDWVTTNHKFYRWLIDQGSPVGFRNDNFGVTRTAVTGKVTLPLVTPEDLGQLAGATNGKVLAVNMRRVGIEWSLIDGGAWWPALPIDLATLVAMQIVIEISKNAGLSWDTLVEPTNGALSTNSFWFNGNRIELPVPGSYFSTGMMYPAAPPASSTVLPPVPDMGWMVRITWGGLQMPLLRRVWLDYDVAEVQPQTGRTWEFDVNLVDPQIGLDGSVEGSPNNAMSKVGRLLTYLESGRSTSFVDLDGQNYRVKVVGFEQRRVAPGALPGLAPDWEGTIKLAEVWPGN